jgi:hypothetical protein
MLWHAEGLGVLRCAQDDTPIDLWRVSVCGGDGGLVDVALVAFLFFHGGEVLGGLFGRAV